MSDIENYLGPHRQTGPGRYELAPIPVRDRAPSRLGQGGFFSGNWGLNEAPHRGTGQGSGKLDPLTPFIWNDLMQEQQNAQAYIDFEYAGVFSNILAASNNEVEQARQTASAGLSPAQKVKADQEVTIQVIHSKLSEYRAHTETAYSLYGHNPFFLMKDLSFKKIRDSLASPNPDVSVAYAAIDRAYRSAMELRRLSWVMAIIANQLPELAARRSQVEAATPTTRDAQQILSAERLSVVNLETNIRLHFLPVFLVERIAAAAGSTGCSLSQTLTNYKIAADNIRAVEQAAVRPYAIANPAINAPLSKPELEALKNLVDLQATTELGKRWQDYHASLLHSESARHMAAAADVFAGLIARAQEAERLQEQIRIAREQEARHLLEQARIAAEAEARRLAEEQAHSGRGHSQRPYLPRARCRFGDRAVVHDVSWSRGSCRGRCGQSASYRSRRHRGLGQSCCECRGWRGRRCFSVGLLVETGQRRIAGPLRLQHAAVGPRARFRTRSARHRGGWRYG